MSRRILSTRATYLYALFVSILVFYLQYPAVPYHIFSLLIWYPKELLLLVTIWKWRHTVWRTVKHYAPTRVSREGIAYW